MADRKFSMESIIGNPKEGEGLEVLFDETGIEITDEQGRVARVQPDHFEQLVAEWHRFRNAQDSANARVA